MQNPAELEIARHAPPSGCTVPDAEHYTRWLATHHYENFNVVSWLLPKPLRQHFYNVYAYCRWADDLGDEVPDPVKAIELLDGWDQELRDCYAGKPSHPVFIALRQTITACDIPIEPFSQLLVAFRQDQTVHRYPTWNSVLDYCCYSANPVGRLVLYLCGYRDAGRQRLSDATCTALQLANFWQDVIRDLEKGRIYIPLDALAAHGLTEEDIVAHRFDRRYVSLMKELIGRTRDLFDQGMPLARSVDFALRVDIEMFSRGGLAVLDSIEAVGYNTLQQRPSIPKSKQLRLLGSALFNRAFDRGQAMTAVPEAPAAAGRLAIVEVAGANSKKAPRASFGEVEQSYAECRRVARDAASNFYYAFYMLPQRKRDALCALYAFMRLVDDVSDTVGSLGDKQRGLARWRAGLDAAASGDVAGHAILPAFADTIRRFEIPVRYFHDLISGAEMDLSVADYPTFERLREYCYRVAGTVGLTCLHVFGFDDPHAPDLAEKLGIAFQLTNILRDVPKDYEMGRVYLPQEDLAQFGVRPEQLARGPLTPELRGLFELEAGRARSFYREGVELIPRVHSDSRAALWALACIYSSLLRRIEDRGYNVFSERVRLSTPEKTGILLRARLGWYSQHNVLQERDRDRRRPGGTSSAVALAETGFRVRLLEMRPHLGGRAASYVLPGGEHVDNCQHVTMGCCTNLEDFYRRVGAEEKVRFFDRLQFATPDGRRGAMSASLLPAPLHMAPSFALFPLLGWTDKRAIARALLKIARSGGQPADLTTGGTGITMLAWLRMQHQTERAIRRFWEVVLVSALDEELDRIDARYGIDVFWKAFLSTRQGYRIGIPCVTLGEIYDGCKEAIGRRGGEVLLRAGVRGFCVRDQQVEGVERDDGSVETADYYLSAVPQDVLPELLPAEVVEREPVFLNLRNLRTSPITGVHLWFDRTVMTEPFLTLLDSTTQWVFNKTRLYGGGAENGGQYLQLVISASYALALRSRQEIIDLCLAELREVLPAIREATLVKGTVVKEMSATFSPAPESDQWRPEQKSPLARLFLAGDWTATGWPSTMEGAVRSGYLAAEAILADAGAPRKCLQPDLRPEGLARLWAR